MYFLADDYRDLVAQAILGAGTEAELLRLE
jgi:hypothetical protein